MKQDEEEWVIRAKKAYAKKGIDDNLIDFDIARGKFQAYNKPITVRCRHNDELVTLRTWSISNGSVPAKCMTDAIWKILYNVEFTRDRIKEMEAYHLNSKCFDFSNLLKKYPDRLSAHDKFMIKCNVCGNEYSTSYVGIMSMKNRGVGCTRTSKGGTSIIRRTPFPIFKEIVMKAFRDRDLDLDRYDFDDMEDGYTGLKSIVSLKCKKHNYIMRNKALAFKKGYIQCKGCQRDYKKANKYHTQESIMREIKKVHGDDIDLSEFIYPNGTQKYATFKCNKHRYPFRWTTQVAVVLRGAKCPRCNQSTVERLRTDSYERAYAVYDVTSKPVSDKHLNVNIEYKIPNISKDMYPKKVPYRYDIYIPEMNHLEELDSIHMHSESEIAIMDKRGYGVKGDGDTVNRDIFKTKLAIKYGYNFKRVDIPNERIRDITEIDRLTLQMLNSVYKYYYNGRYYHKREIRELKENIHLNGVEIPKLNDYSKYGITWVLKDPDKITEGLKYRNKRQVSDRTLRYRKSKQIMKELLNDKQ